MRALIVLVVGMGVLIVVGVGVVAATIMHRMGGPAAVAIAASATLDEPAGTHIATIGAAGDRLAVLLQGGGADRVVFVDKTGVVQARLTLRPVATRPPLP